MLCESEGGSLQLSGLVPQIVVRFRVDGRETWYERYMLNLSLALESSALYLSHKTVTKTSKGKQNNNKKTYSKTVGSVILSFCLVWCSFRLTVKFQVVSEEMRSVCRRELWSTLLVSTIWRQVWDQESVYAFESFKMQLFLVAGLVDVQ